MVHHSDYKAETCLYLRNILFASSSTAQYKSLSSVLNIHLVLLIVPSVYKYINIHLYEFHIMVQYCLHRGSFPLSLCFLSFKHSDTHSDNYSLFMSLIYTIPLWRARGSSLQYPCLENPVDRGAWRAAVHRVSQGWIRLKQHTHSTAWIREDLFTHSALEELLYCFQF